MPNPTEDHWLSIFEDCKQSGLSQRKFCDKNDLPFSKFRYYYNKLIRAKSSSANLNFQNEAVNFEPVIINKETSTQSVPSIPLKIKFPNQILCSIEVELISLKPVLKEIKSLC